MEINFSMNVTAADTAKREISGRVVTWDEQGFTSAGASMFKRGSISVPDRVKLLMEHERTKPLGFLKSYEVTDQGIDATFVLAKTFSADDALEEAASGLRDGFSVGVKVDAWDNKDGVMVISKSNLIEVSLVTDPAIDSARVASVAASETEAPVDNQVSEATVSDVKTEGEDLMSETVSEATVTETVEASKSEATVTANAPVAYSTPRVNTNVTAGQFAKAQIAALRGDADARDLVAALQVATVAENTGMVPPTYLRDVIGVIDSSRPFIDSIERAALPASGMKIFTPKLGAQATVAVTAEGAEFSSTDTAVTFQEDTVVKFAGAGKIDVELLDRSDPSFLDLYLRELAASYAQKTDAYAAQIAAQNATQSSSSTIYKAIALGIAEIRREVTGNKPGVIIGAADVYVSDFGAVSVVPNRFQRERDAFVLDPEYASVAFLRPFQTVELAKTGLLGYAHGEYPFVLYRREYLSRKLHDSRGLPEPGKPWQDQIKAHKDARIDAASLGVLPPICYPQ